MNEDHRSHHPNSADRCGASGELRHSMSYHVYSRNSQAVKGLRLQCLCASGWLQLSYSCLQPMLFCMNLKSWECDPDAQVTK